MYCTQQEVRGMIKDDALNALIGDRYIDDPDERERLIAPIVDEAIADASGEIDGYIAKRYPVPLSSIPAVIRKFSKDMAVYNLFSRIGIADGEKEKNYLVRYQAAVRYFENVAKGIIDLDTGTGTTTQKASTGFMAQSSARRFSRDSMKGL